MESVYNEHQSLYHKWAHSKVGAVGRGVSGERSGRGIRDRTDRSWFGWWSESWAGAGRSSGCRCVAMESTCQRAKTMPFAICNTAAVRGGNESYGRARLRPVMLRGTIEAVGGRVRAIFHAGGGTNRVGRGPIPSRYACRCGRELPAVPCAVAGSTRTAPAVSRCAGRLALSRIQVPIAHIVDAVPSLPPPAHAARNPRGRGRPIHCIRPDLVRLHTAIVLGLPHVARAQDLRHVQ
jgi:hypothetical protein